MSATVISIKEWKRKRLLKKRREFEENLQREKEVFEIGTIKAHCRKKTKCLPPTL